VTAEVLLLDKLRSIVGPQHVLTGVDRSPYVVEGRTPEAAVFPGTIDEVRAVVEVMPAPEPTGLYWSSYP
jgi:hypothetical protein